MTQKLSLTRTPEARTPICLKPLQPWRTAEQFRKNLTDNVRSIERGKVGTLTMKGKTIRMLADEDFQELYGLAQEIDRLRDGIEIIIAAAITVQETRAESAVTVLTKAALAFGHMPILPTRAASQEFNIEEIPADEIEQDDSFDFNNVKRPF